MNIEKLMELRNSHEAPFDHEQYTIWLHNKILEEILRDISMCQQWNGHIMSLPSLKVINNK